MKFIDDVRLYIDGRDPIWMAISFFAIGYSFSWLFSYGFIGFFTLLVIYVTILLVSPRRGK